MSNDIKEDISEYSKVLKLFNPPKNLTFLIGAGCSLDSPTNIPSTRKIMDTIIEYICVPPEVDRIKKIENFRFEALIEVFRDVLDPDLRIIDYFELFKNPNAQHYFLAEMIKKNNFVMTTNFDFLIEYALRESGIRIRNINIVISKSEFEKYANPSELLKKGKKSLYKIHGSTKNIITGKEKRDSLITTIQALGSNKSGVDLFSIEAFKRPLFENISKHRKLIIMGYSGSDDFDIVPTLKLLKDLRNIVWINHVSNDKGGIKIQKLNHNLDTISKENDRVNQILREIQQKNNTLRILRVDVNISDLIISMNQYFGGINKSKSTSFRVPPLARWIKKKIPMPQNEKFFIKNFIPAKIYLDFNKYADVERCAEQIMDKAREIRSIYWEGIASFFFGRVYRNKNNTHASEEQFTNAIDLLNKNRDIEEKKLRKISVLLMDFIKYFCRPRSTFRHIRNIRKIRRKDGLYYLYRVQIEYANVRANQGKYKEAIGLYLDTLKEINLRNELREIRAIKEIQATIYGYLGNAYRNQGKYSKCIKNYNSALEIFKETGDIRNQGIYKYNLGLVYRNIGQFKKQKKKMEESLHIAKMIRDIRGESKAIGGIASARGYLGDYDKAVRDHKKSIEIIKEQDAILIKGYLQEDYAKTEMFSQNYEVAREKFEEALKNTKKNHNLLNQRRKTYIALTYLLESKIEEASKYIQKALKHNDSEISLVLKTFTCVVDGIIKARKHEKSLANDSFLTASELAKEQLAEENDYFTYSNKIISLIGMILITDKKDMDNLWVKKINQHNISIRPFESIGKFKEFTLLCESLMPINPNFINSKKELFKPSNQ